MGLGDIERLRSQQGWSWGSKELGYHKVRTIME